MKIYFAGPLFSEAEREWIRSTIRKIEALAAEKSIQTDVIFPYDLITAEEIELLGDQAKHEIFHRCKAHLHDTDMMIALLDGTQVDDGTAWEIGYFYRGKADGAKIIGVRTDFRNAGEGRNSVVNAMVECACDRVVRSSVELVEVLAEMLGGLNSDQVAARSRAGRIIPTGGLSEQEIAALENAVKSYDFPCNSYDFLNNRPIQHSNMKEVERFIRNGLLSEIPESVKNGLSNVLYWGYGDAGIRDAKVAKFRNNVTDEQLIKAMRLFSSISGDSLEEIKKIELPQFGYMSFVSKIRMFLDSDRYVVLDRQILKMRKEPVKTLLDEISFGPTEQAIRISGNNVKVYVTWCDKCREISQTYFDGKYRPVDIERGFFSLIRQGKVNMAAKILSKA